MKTSTKGLELIKYYEGLKLEAYKCPANIITIGYGTTRYPNGKEILMGDKCTKEEAEEYLQNDLSFLEKKVSSHFKEIDQNQFDALISFAYNLGFGALLSSTLRSKILKDPNDKTIKDEFLKWCHVGKVKLTGLLKRRSAEYILYSEGILKFI